MRRPFLHQLGVTGLLVFLGVLLSTATAYLWNNRKLPAPPSAHSGRGTWHATGWVVRRTLARQPLARAGFFFTLRVLGRSVQNRFSIAVALAIATALGTVSLRMGAPTTIFAVQLLFVVAVVAAFRHSIRVPAELRARWLFHVVRPADQSLYLAGAKRAAVMKLIVPTLLALLPLHVLVFGWRAAFLHSAYGILVALVLFEGLLLQYRRLPFASSYVPTTDLSTRGPLYAFAFLLGIYALAWLERFAFQSAERMTVLFGMTAGCLAAVRAIDLWQRRERSDVELDELVELPTLRLDLMD
jgi:hypothetical protein